MAKAIGAAWAVKIWRGTARKYGVRRRGAVWQPYINN
jgi:hypothetical protein